MEIQKLKISYSRLSDYDRNGASALLEKTQTQSTALSKGSLVNDLLFETVDFEKKYTMKIYERPTATLLKLANIIIENFVTIPTNEEIEELIERNGFWKLVKRENLHTKYDTPEFWDYLENQITSVDKISITPSMKLEADEIVSILKSHKNSSYFFNNPDLELHPEFLFNVDYYNILSKSKDVKPITLRGIVDMVVINRKDKTIRLVDLKTGSDKSSEFEYSFIKWRYYLQESVYMQAIDYIREKLNAVDYEVLPFQFLYIGLKEKIPAVFTVTEKWHNAALNGFETKSGYRYKGLYELLNEIEYIWLNKTYDTPYLLQINKGQISLNDTFITV